MTNDLERQLADHLDQVARRATPLGDLEGVRSGVPRSSDGHAASDRRHTARPLLVGAAAAVLVLGVVGIATLGDRADDRGAAPSAPSDQPVAATSTILDSSTASTHLVSTTTSPVVGESDAAGFDARLTTPAGWEVTAEEIGENFHRLVLRDDRGRSLDAIARWADATDAPTHDPVAGAVVDEGIVELGAGSYRLVRTTSDGAVDAGIRPVIVDVVGSGFDDPGGFETAAVSLTIELPSGPEAGGVPYATTTSIAAAADSGAAQRAWNCRWIVRNDDDTASLAVRFDVGIDEIVARLGDPTDWLSPGNPIDAPCDRVPGWEGGAVTVTDVAPSVDGTDQTGLPPSARLFGLGASGATVEIGPVESSGSILQVEVFEGDGDLAWGGGLTIPECDGGLSFDDPAATTGRTVVVRMRCAQPPMQVSLDLLGEATWLQTDARVTVANNSAIGGVAGRLTYLLTDRYVLSEPANGGDDAPATTTVFHRPGFDQAAASIAAAVTVAGVDAPTALWPTELPGLTAEDVDLADTDILVVIGDDVDLDTLG